MKKTLVLKLIMLVLSIVCILSFFGCDSANEEESLKGVKRSLVYKLNSDGTLSVAYEGTSEDGIIVIPPLYKGSPVVRIEGDAFSRNQSIRAVSIPDSILYIAENAFEGSNALIYNEYDNALYLGNEENPYHALIKAKSDEITSCEIHDKTVVLASGAFANCRSLRSLTIPENIRSIGYGSVTACDNLVEIINRSHFVIEKGRADNVGYFAKNICSSAEETKIKTTEEGYVLYEDEDTACFMQYVGSETDLILPAGITEISSRAFKDNATLHSVVIPDSVTEIGAHAFDGCGNLRSVTIGAGVTNVQANAFYQCFCLAEVLNRSELTITKGTPDHGYVGYYAEYIGTGEETSHITTDEAGFVLLRHGEESILTDYVGSEVNLILPTEITRVGKYAFSDCVNLTSVSIPHSVKEIDKEAFYSCYNLQSIYYDGTFEEWSVIADGGPLFGNYAVSYDICCTNVTMHCRNLVIKNAENKATIYDGSFFTVTMMPAPIPEATVFYIDGEAVKDPFSPGIIYYPST